jgi:hypothetical protein
MSDFSRDVVSTIFGYLPWHDIVLSACMVCKLWKRVSKSNELFDVLSIVQWPSLDFDMIHRRLDDINADIEKDHWYNYFMDRLYLDVANTKTRFHSIRDRLGKYERYPNKLYLEEIIRLAQEEINKPNDAFLDAWMKSAYMSQAKRDEITKLRKNVYVKKYIRRDNDGSHTIDCKARIYLPDGDFVSIFFELEETQNKLSRKQVTSELSAELYYHYTREQRHADKSRRIKKKREQEEDKEVDIFAKITYGDQTDSDDDDDDQFKEGEIVAQLDDIGHTGLLHFNDGTNTQLYEESDDSDEEDDEDFMDYERRVLMQCQSFGGMNHRNMKVDRKNLDWLYDRVYPVTNPVVSKELFYHFLLVRAGGEQGFIY